MRRQTFAGMDYLRATLFTRQSPEALANSQMGAWASMQYRLLQLFLHMSGCWNPDDRQVGKTNMREPT